MDREIAYTKAVGAAHVKSLGQYFTSLNIAEFMCSWACKNATTMLDPAAGSSVFLNCARQSFPDCFLTGYEIDSAVIDYFGNPASADLRQEDYLLNGWNEKYDAIVGNPPYNRFQAVTNRQEIIESIYSHTGIKCSKYTNLYILFLIKSIYQLSENGRLAYIIPTEFLNSGYGVYAKELLLKNQLLKAVINFKNNNEVFFNATTTCCILLLEKGGISDNAQISFFNLSSAEELDILGETPEVLHPSYVAYADIKADEKWRPYLNHEVLHTYRNLADVSNFCTVSRGIATGANDFFCFSKSKIEKYKIPEAAISKCICRSADVKTAIFTAEDFRTLAESDKTVYLLDIHETGKDINLRNYIKKGESENIDKKHLPAHRHPWFAMEKKPTAHIFVSSAYRNGIKFVRNLAEIKSLTTFHSIFVKEEYRDYIDIIFCYFLTPTAQEIVRENRKDLGSGLEKFQPNDLNSAKMLDLTLISEADKKAIIAVYKAMLSTREGARAAHIDKLEQIFSKYLFT